MSTPRTKLADAHGIEKIYQCLENHGPKYHCTRWKMHVRIGGAGSIVMHVRYQDICDPLGRPRSRLTAAQAEIALENAR